MAAPLRHVVFKQIVHRNISLLQNAPMPVPLPLCRGCSHILQSSPYHSRRVISNILVFRRHFENDVEGGVFRYFHSLNDSACLPKRVILTHWCHSIGQDPQAINVVNKNTAYSRVLSMCGHSRLPQGRHVSTYILQHQHVNRLAMSVHLLHLSDRNIQRRNISNEKRFQPLISQKENIYTVPNLLTLIRMISAPFLGYMVMNEQFVWALAVFALAGLTDLLDGFIARNFKNQNSILGSAMDPMADKILVFALTFTLTAVDLIPLPLTVLIVGRDIGLIAAAFYLRYISLPPPKTLSRYFDVTLVSAKMEPFLISKWNTAFQLSLVALTLAAPVFDFVNHPLLQGLWYLTGFTTVISGMKYVLYWKDSVKIVIPSKKV